MITSGQEGRRKANLSKRGAIEGKGVHLYRLTDWGDRIKKMVTCSELSGSG